jgi:hypothetical protein
VTPSIAFLLGLRRRRLAFGRFGGNMSSHTRILVALLATRETETVVTI